MRLGEHDIKTGIDCDWCSPAIDVEIEKVLIHTNFIMKKTTLGFDIALLRLKESVAFTRLIKPVCLPTEVRNHQLKGEDAENMIVIGFGRTTENVTESTVLMKAVIPFVPWDHCSKLFEGMSTVKVLHKGHMCAGGGAADSCQGLMTFEKFNAFFHSFLQISGDSGGPLIAFSENEKNHTRFFQYGIVSFGLSCGIAPAVYIDVRYFIEWISSNVEP